MTHINTLYVCKHSLCCKKAYIYINTCVKGYTYFLSPMLVYMYTYMSIEISTYKLHNVHSQKDKYTSTLLIYVNI